MTAPFPILYEDNHLLAVLKPPGIATMGVAEDRPSILNMAREYIKGRYKKPGNVYLGVVSRLDAPVSGVLLFARTSKAAARLNEQFRARQVEKVYWAVVPEAIDPAEGVLEDWLLADERHRRVHIRREETEGAKSARLSYRQLRKTNNRGYLVEVRLETGRKHQIRVQLARAGQPVIGDRKYGSREPFSAGIALHARRLVFTHPVQKTEIDLTAPLPPSWRKFGLE